MESKGNNLLTFHKCTKLRIFISLIGLLENLHSGIKCADGLKTAGMLSGFRVNSYSTRCPTADGRISIPSGSYSTLRLFLSDGLFAPDAQVSFTETAAAKGTNCDELRSSSIFNLTSAVDDSALVDVQLWARYEASGGAESNLTYLMFCLRQTPVGVGAPSSWIHQGDSPWLQIAAAPQKDLTSSGLIPLWAKCVLIVVFITFSGLFTGLGLGLLSLTRRELKTMRNLGSAREKRYAKVNMNFVSLFHMIKQSRPTSLQDLRYKEVKYSFSKMPSNNIPIRYIC